MTKYRKVEYKDNEEVFYWDYDANALSTGRTENYTSHWGGEDFVAIKKPYKYLNARQVRCYTVDDSISPSNIYVCKCRIDRPLSNFEGYIETEHGEWMCEYYDEVVFDTYEEAEQARIKFLKDMLKEAEGKTK